MQKGVRHERNSSQYIYYRNVFGGKYRYISGNLVEIEISGRRNMSKTKVIEIFESTQMVVQIGADTKGRVVTTTRSVDELRTLNSDYINENFGDLQDTAYQRGLEDGKQAAVGAAELREKLEYQKGLDDAWECAKKLFSTMSDTEIEKVFPNEWNNGGFNALINLQPQEAIEKLKAYEEKQKTADEIKVGDELEHTVSGYTSKAIFLEKIGNDEDEDWYKCLFWTGCGVAILSYPKRQFKHTGNHFDIDKILEEMRT